MQALMLAMGMEKRLEKYTDSNTKCMVEVTRTKLIDRAIEALKYAGITKLSIVIGYKGSYGIPGLRLGILACADDKKLTKIQEGMAIWNINSFAEYFFQIINLYEKDYLALSHIKLMR